MTTLYMEDLWAGGKINTHDAERELASIGQSRSSALTREDRLLGNARVGRTWSTRGRTCALARALQREDPSARMHASTLTCAAVRSYNLSSRPRCLLRDTVLQDTARLQTLQLAAYGGGSTARGAQTAQVCVRTALLPEDCASSRPS